MKVRGLCVYAEQRQSRAGSRYWRVGLKGEDGKVRFFNTTDFAGRVGDTATIEVSDAEFRRATRTPPEAAPVAPVPQDRDFLIVKHVALKAAVELAASRPAQAWSTGDILRIAEEFARWLHSYYPPVEPESEEPPSDEEVIEL